MPNQAALAQCDARLAAVLGERVVKLSSLSAKIGPLLTPVPTPKLTYTVRWGSPALPPGQVRPAAVELLLPKGQASHAHQTAQRASQPAVTPAYESLPWTPPLCHLPDTYCMICCGALRSGHEAVVCAAAGRRGRQSGSATTWIMRSPRGDGRSGFLCSRGSLRTRSLMR